ncbi:uncharacterized protein LOC128965128 [Oppia nitens]|uniref:uncharacterized protein LOC128965128 n=1 Tax=Oppia nitens TaxID=1686743 RepID=UPI0023DAB05C|nr:uncharacterized protein LOC128965128 [Oppia nitens]
MIKSNAFILLVTIACVSAQFGNFFPNHRHTDDCDHNSNGQHGNRHFPGLPIPRFPNIFGHQHHGQHHHHQQQQQQDSGIGGQFPAPLAENGQFTAENVRRMPLAVPETHLNFTATQMTNMTVFKNIVCTGGPIKRITLDSTFPSEVTCNGYDAWVSPWTYQVVTVDNRRENLTIANFSQYYTYLNGNQYEVNYGEISEGRCKGDMFFSVNVYVADQQLGCSGSGLKSASIDYINAHIYGSNCASNCQLDAKVKSFFRYDPPIHN